MKITNETVIGEILEKYPETREVFLKLGYKCVFCIVQIKDTIADAAKHYKKSPTALIKAIEKRIK